MDNNLETTLNACATFTESLAASDCRHERKERIKCFLHKVAQQPVSVGDFKVGLEWFNCKEPLSFTRHLKGKIVVLDFFTYCCINCLHIIPHLRQLEKRFSVKDGVVIIGVHSAKFDNEKDSGNISAALQRYDISHPVVNDCDGILWSKLGISCWPTLLILGPNGQPLFQLVGEFEEKVLFELINVSVDYFGQRGELSSHHLPPPSATSIIRGPLLFPGKVTTVIQDDGSELIAIANSGLHSLIIASADGTIKYIIGCPDKPGLVDGDFEVARFNAPQGLSFSTPHLLYVDLRKKTVFTLVGNGLQASVNVSQSSGAAQSLSSPWDLCFIRRKVLAPQNITQPFLCICPPAPSGYRGSGEENNKPFPPATHLPASSVPPPQPPPFPMSSTLPSSPPPAASGMPPPPPPPPLSSNLSSNLLPPQTLTCSAENEAKEFIEQEILAIAMAGSHQIWVYFFQDTMWWGKEFFSAGVCANVAGSGNEANRNNAYPLSASFAQPSGLSYCPSNDELFIADSESSSVRSINMKTGKVSGVVGGSKKPDDLFSFGDVDGVGYNAKLQHPLGVAWHEESKNIFVADSYNHKIKKINLHTMTCSTYAGGGSAPDLALFNEPGGLCVSADGAKLYVADTNNHCIKVICLLTSSVAELKLLSDEQAPGISPVCTVTVPLSVNFNGKIILKVNLSLSDGIKLTEGAPQRWSLHLPGKHFNVSWRTESLNGTLDSRNAEVYITAPPAQYSGGPHEIKLTLKSFLCADGACKAVTSSLLFSVACSADAPNSVEYKANFTV
ncbi:NHL repeat-containing protein 2 [Frankliniella fusca]|uniref:NHL repeat-containing protein 2 n=1 Tax=Frankliniella fusca TaxID=407009 RepID=A0AAE1H022_9NEOP|nr:NHL repeat-containing protein 2 [Frankliniella fusca]